MTVGEALASARGQAGLTVTQVSQRTRVREALIRDIERDDFAACGGDFYTRGHIRSIARAVGADPGEMIRAYDAAHGVSHELTAAEAFEPATAIRLRERRSPNWSMAMVMVLALVIGYGVYRVIAPGSTPARPLAEHPAHGRVHSHQTKPAGAGADTTAAPHGHGIVIRLTAVADCWVEFSRPNGTYLSQTDVLAGNSQTWHFRHPVTMRIGNPGEIKLTVNGTDLVQPGIAGQPMTLTFGPNRPLPKVPGAAGSGATGGGSSGAG